MSEYKKGQAYNLLRYYIKTAWENAGLNWDNDNDAEIEELINLLMEENKK